MLLSNYAEPVRHRRLVWLTVLVVSLCFAQEGGAQSAAVLRGVVTDSLGEQIPAIVISLYSPDRVLQNKSDKIGHFEFTHLPPGTYELEASGPGFKTKTIDAVHTSDGSNPLSIVLEVANTGDCSSEALISYEKNTGMGRSKLTGVVLDAKRPMPKITVHLVKTSGTQVRISQRSNEKGEFRFVDLDPGRYLLRVSYPGYREEQTQSFWIARENRTKVVMQVVKQGLMRVCE